MSVDVSIKLTSEEAAYCREVHGQRKKLRRQQSTPSIVIFMKVVDEVVKEVKE